MNTFFTARLAPLPLALKCGPEENADTAVHSVTDEVLLTRLQAGEQEALGCLFQRYSRVVRTIATRILRDSTEAEDLVQDLFLFIHRKCSTFDRTKTSGGSWIVHMAYQRALERRRYLAKRHFYKHLDVQRNASQLVGKATAENDYSPEAVFGRNGMEKVLGCLNGDQRETLRLHFFEGYTLAEIGAKLGQSLGNVRHHYYRGLDRLRKQMFARNVQGS